MNQGRLWTVVNPTVGLPLFLGGVAVMSFTIHFAVLGSTTWMAAYWNGTGMKAAATETVSPPLADVAAVKGSELAIEVARAPAISTDGSAEIVVKIKPKTGLPDPS
jgi:light-harvesting protein B-800-850 alpha chain